MNASSGADIEVARDASARRLRRLLNWTRSLPALSLGFDWTLFGLLLLLFVLNLQRLGNDFVPLHDSLQVFQVFHYAYSCLASVGSMPEWMPFGVFGMPIDYWRLSHFTPCSYLVMYLGASLGIENALLLFKLSLFFEQSVLLLGTYLLAREILHSRYAIFMVCVGAICTLDWTYQIWWSFRLFYAVPLALFFLMRFFRRLESASLWGCGVCVVASLIGNIQYLAPIYLYLFLTVALVMVVADRSAVKTLLTPTRKSIVAFLVFLVLSFLYVTAVYRSLQHISSSDVQGRDPETRTVQLRNFLHHGGRPSAGELLKMLIVGSPTHGIWSGQLDQTIYTGLLAMVLVPLAIVKIRRREFVAVAAGLLFLLLLIQGGIFARAFYHLPGMALFRHLGLLFPLVRILFLVVAGFSLDWLVSARRFDVLLGLLIVLILLGDASGAYHGLMTFLHLVQQVSIPMALVADSSCALGFRVGLYSMVALWMLVELAFRRSREPRETRHVIGKSSMENAALLVCVCFLIDVAIFNREMAHSVPAFDGKLPADLFEVRTPRFPLERQRPEDNPFLAQASELMRWAQSRGEVYQTTYDFLQYSPAESEYFTPLTVEGVQRLLDQLKMDRPNVEPASQKAIVSQRGAPNLTEAEAAVMGYTEPRLRLVQKAIMAKSAEHAVRLIETAGLNAVPLEALGIPDEAHEGVVAGSELGNVSVLSFESDRLELSVNVGAAPGAWLVHSDAYHPDWIAKVDGDRTEIYRAYGALRAIHLGPGRHQVVFEFRPTLVSIGRMLAFTGVVLSMTAIGLFGHTLFHRDAMAKAAASVTP